jgi:hypothetical protein
MFAISRVLCATDFPAPEVFNSFEVSYCLRFIILIDVFIFRPP